jgi:hypothetical protein
MAQQRWGAEDGRRGKPKEEEGVWWNVRVAKGRRMPFNPFIGNKRGPKFPSTPALTTSRIPHKLNVWQLPHYAKQFSLLSEIEALWESTRVNTRLFESAAHSCAFLPGVLGLRSVTCHVRCDPSCHWACVPCGAIPRQPRSGIARGTVGGYCRCSGPGVPAPVAWPAPPRPRIRLYRPATSLRRCRPIGCRFRAVRSHLQAHLRDEDEAHR